MRQSADNGYIYSRLTCMDACETVAQRYQSLRRTLPTGIFLSPILDLQAFTATVVLLLTSHSAPSSDRVEFEARKARVHGIASQVLNVMDEKSREAGRASFARQGAITIRSLSQLLQQNGDGLAANQLSLTVPLLGNVNIRRNVDPPIIGTQQAAQYWNPNGSAVSQPTASEMNFGAGSLLPGVSQAPAEWQWNPLSWSVDGAVNNIFQDAFMADSADFGTWQGDYNGFQFMA